MTSLVELKTYCFDKNRVCPMPTYWHEMYELIVGAKRSDLAAPLILAGWWMSNDADKIERMKIHLDYAERNGTIERVDRYLRSLPDEHWYVSEHDVQWNDEW